MYKIGDSIRELRLKRKLSQQKLAQNILPEKRLYYIEKNIKSPTIDEFIKLMVRLNFDPNEFSNLLPINDKSKFSELKYELQEFTKQNTITQSMFFDFDQKLKKYKDTDTRILNLYIIFKFTYKDKDFVNPLTKTEIDDIYTLLVSTDIHSFAEYKILANLITLINFPTIESLYNKMFPVVHPEWRDTDFFLNIAVIHNNIITEAIKQHWYGKAEKYISIAKKMTSTSDYFGNLQISYLTELNLYAQTGDLKHYKNALQFALISKDFNDDEHYKTLEIELNNIHNKMLEKS